MHNAESETKYKTNTSELRQRKFKRKESSKSRGKMVGSGGGEPLGQDLADIRMELLELDSEDDEIYEYSDTKHLIPSPVPEISIQKIDSYSKDLDILKDEDENVWSISIQMFIPFLLAGFGMVAASLLLDVVQVNVKYLKKSYIVQSTKKATAKFVFYI